jgi:hypothetical protein
MDNDDSKVLEGVLNIKDRQDVTPLTPLQLDRLIISTLTDKKLTEESRQNRIRIIAEHVTERLSSPISVAKLIEAIDNPKQDLPDDLKDLLGNQKFWKLRDILNKLISSEKTKHFLPKGRIALSKNLLGILDELEEKYYFILTKPKLDALKYSFETKDTIIDLDGIGPKKINNKIMELLNTPDELTPGFLRACVAFVMASKPYGSNKSLGKQRTIDKLDNSDQQVISGITKLVNSRIKGILETAEASEESYNDRDTESRLETLLADKKFVAIEKMLRGLIHLKPEATDASLRSDKNGLIDEINAASDILKSLNDLRAEIRKETPTNLLTILEQLSPPHEQAS